MKNLAMLTMASLCLMGCSLLGSRSSFDYLITEKNWNSQTFMVVHNQNIPEDVASPIESGIAKRFRALGYETDERDPDVLVHYTVYNGDYTLKTWVQPKTRFWFNSDPSKNHEFERKNKKMTGESLYISVFDNIHNKVIWRGYDDKGTYADNDRLLQAKVYRVLDEFNLTANRFPEELTSYKPITSLGDL